MTDRTSLTVVLAAGEGTRMRSPLPKVLHPVAGQPLLAHVLEAAPHGAGTALAVVVGPDHAPVEAEVKRLRPDAASFVQSERLGTAHAVLAARQAIARGADDLLVAFGGRLLLEGDRLVAIREQADASAEERKVTLCNAGVMAFDGRQALKILDKIGNANSKGEYYLVDAVTIVRDLGLEAVVIETSEDEVRGINTKAQLAEAEAVMQARLRKAALDAGVTLIAPETTFLSADTKFGRDVTIEPFVVIGPGVSIDDGAVIHSFSHIVQAAIGKKASVGPYARIRPGTSLGEGARIGNFVETKAAILEAGVKVNHLSYIGDTHIGVGANIGAGTITCNYDGSGKHKTTIGEGAFVGTNSSLVAPVKIGNGAYIGSGSVITKDVPDDALAVERSPQNNREGGAKRYREMKLRSKKPKES